MFRGKRNSRLRTGLFAGKLAGFMRTMDASYAGSMWLERTGGVMQGVINVENPQS